MKGFHRTDWLHSTETRLMPMQPVKALSFNIRETYIN